jgi:hypothetical protein
MSGCVSPLSLPRMHAMETWSGVSEDPDTSGRVYQFSASHVKRAGD